MSPGILTNSVVSDTALPASIPESHQTPANKETERLFSLSGTTAVVTGGGRGLGITIAVAIVEAGGNVACLDILAEPSADEWASLKNLAKMSGCWVAYYKCDITQEKDMEGVFDTVATEAERLQAPLSGTVACAGIQQKSPALEYPVEDFERVMRVNVAGAFLTVRQAAKIMVKNGTRGSIVLIASMSGQIANRVRMAKAWEKT